MPIFTIQDGLSEKQIENLRHMKNVSRIKECGCGTCTLNREALTEKDVEMIMSGVMPTLSIKNDFISICLYDVSFLNVFSEDDLYKDIVFVYKKSIINNLSIK